MIIFKSKLVWVEIIKDFVKIYDRWGSKVWHQAQLFTLIRVEPMDGTDAFGACLVDPGVFIVHLCHLIY